MQKGRQTKGGFALPTVLIASVVMMTVLAVSVSSVVAVRTALQTQYYQQLAKAAGEAGVAYAKACLAKNGNVALWSNAKPLTPATDCAGNSLISNNPFRALVVAGGGSGGGSTGGGGGGGGVIANDYFALSNGTYSVTVGAGGVTPGNQAPGQNGGNSVFNGWTAVGGGGGGYSKSGGPNGGGQTGGSGGGGEIYAGSNGPGAGTAGQGNAGGSISGIPAGSTTGGGGAGGPGLVSSAANAGGNGGPGIPSNITGVSLYYGGGGAGGGTGAAATGGAGGGGNGGDIGSAGAPNTGGGGGGGWSYASGNGGAGGSGVVIISFPNNGAVTASATGGYQTYTSGPNTVYAFNSSGSFTVSAQSNSTCPSDPRCSVVVNTNLRSSFSVGAPTTDAQGKALTIPNNGYVQLLRNSTGAVWRTYPQPSVQAAVVPDLCSGAATSSLGWANAVAAGTQDTIPNASSATTISMSTASEAAGAMYFRKDFPVNVSGTYTVSVLTDNSQDNAAIYVDGNYMATSQGSLATGTIALTAGCHTVTTKLTNQTMLNRNSYFTAAIQLPGSAPILTTDTSWRVDAGSVVDFSNPNYYMDPSSWGPAVRYKSVQQDINTNWGNLTGDLFTAFIAPTNNGCPSSCPASSSTFYRDNNDFVLTANTNVKVSALCDDNCTVYIDGKEVIDGSQYPSITQQTITLTPGSHRLAAMGSNGGLGPSGIGITAVDDSGNILARTDNSWLVSNTWYNTPVGTIPYSYDASFIPSPNEIAQTRTYDALVVAGGGGGGDNSAGGGGAGGVIPLNGVTAALGTYNITIGAGGTGAANNNVSGANGGNTTFGSYTALGGGGGASRDGGNPASAGGSGGGGAGASVAARTLAGAGSPPQGYIGGAGTAADAGVNSTGGGGGGAGGPGMTGVSGGTAGNGGPGYITYMTGTRLGVGGGGGGAITVNGSTGWSTDGGGNGNSMAALNGVANTGGGGGGRSAVANGGNGGSGLVVVRFVTGTLTASATGTYTTTTATINNVSYTIYTFTGNGSFTISAIN